MKLDRGVKTASNYGRWIDLIDRKIDHHLKIKKWTLFVMLKVRKVIYFLYPIFRGVFSSFYTQVLILIVIFNNISLSFSLSLSQTDQYSQTYYSLLCFAWRRPIWISVQSDSNNRERKRQSIREDEDGVKA